MAYVLITAPAAEPVTLAEAQTQCAVDFSEHNGRLNRLIAAARARCEAVTGRALITQTWELRLDAWPYMPHLCPIDRYAIWLGKPPVQSITSVKYLDTAGVEQTMVSGTDYTSSIADPLTRIVPGYGLSWPMLRADTPDAIKIRFVCGYGDGEEDVPQDLRAGMLMLIDHLFRNTSDEITGTITSKFDTASHAIFMTHSTGLVY